MENKYKQTEDRIDHLLHMIKVDAFALLKFFGYGGKLESFDFLDILHDDASLEVTVSYIKNIKLLHSSVDPVPEEYIILIHKLTLSILNKMYETFELMDIVHTTSKYITHADKMTSLLLSKQLKGENQHIPSAVKAEYIFKLLNVSNEACLLGGDDVINTSLKIFNKYLRNVAIGKFGQEVRYDILKGKYKYKIKELSDKQAYYLQTQISNIPSKIRGFIINNLM